MIDLTHVLQERFNKNEINEIKVINDTEITGYKLTNGWAKEQHIYFHAKFNKPFTIKIYDNGTLVEGSEKKSQLIKAVLEFEPNNEPLLAKVGISAVDYEGAKMNLETEVPHWDFEKVKNQAYELGIKH
ncbi:alpha-1,2-mannosidase [Jejuia pallidilutea]|uniref:Alpha-1,2-mannosidase n=1 Tax=Jejuia pallidilutea TaxID=504487 RepID=A0A090W5U2_9FLAO|nr:alpha-1,2-mannosidase [Jejuia pallidilutea]